MLDERIICNYVDARLLSVGNIDFPTKVRYKVRKKKPSVRGDKKCHLGRTYEDFLEYTAANPDIPVVEIDFVEGRKGGKVLLTVLFRNSNLMLSAHWFIKASQSIRFTSISFTKLRFDYKDYISKLQSGVSPYNSAKSK